MSNKPKPVWRWYDSLTAVALWSACISLGLVVGFWLLGLVAR